MTDLYLHRISDLQGRKHCAMTAVAKMLGYEKVSDTPDEVDPGLAALVTLLNDRADGRVRQVLTSRLPHVLHTGRTELARLIAEVFMPSAIRRNKFRYEAQAAENWDDLQDAAKIYGSLGARFLEADGRGYLAGGCITLAAALETTDPTTQDILAVSAAGEIASFETGEGWSELLHILDYVIGLSDTRPFIGQQMGNEIGIALSASEEVSTGLLDTDDPLQPLLHVVPENLLSAMWLQLAQHVSSSKGLRQCAHCSKWFEHGTGTGRRRTGHYCEDKCRKAHWTARNQKKPKGPSRSKSRTAK